MKNSCVSNILYEFPNEDSFRVETCINPVCHLLNWFLFDRSACTVVLFTFLSAVMQRNLLRCCWSWHVPCHSTAIIWVAEVWSYIVRKVQTFYRTPTHNTMFPLRSFVVQFEIQQADKFCHKILRYVKDAIIAFPKQPTLNNVQCSSDLPWRRATCWPALLIWYIIL